MEQYKKTLKDYLEGNLKQAEQAMLHENGIASTRAIHIPFYERLAIRINHDAFAKTFAFTGALKEALETQNTKHFLETYKKIYNQLKDE